MRQERGNRAAGPSPGPSRHAVVPVDRRHAEVLALQRSVGNRATSRLMDPPEASPARAAERPTLKRWWGRPKADAAAGSKGKELDACARAEAKELIRRAEEEEPRVTRLIRQVAFGRRGKPKGLEFKIKSEESLARKIRDGAAEKPMGMVDPSAAAREEADQINDALRYTIILEPDGSYGRLFAEIGEKMQLYKYTPVVSKNYWEKSTVYKGINMIFRTPGVSSMGFEVQLHTDDSFATKQLNHHEYEDVRAVGTTPEQKKALNNTMEQRWDAVQVPEGFFSVQPTRARS
jgi:hypothetical protein